MCSDIVRAQVMPYALLFLCPSALRLDSDWHPRHHVYLQMYGMLRLEFLSTKLCLEQKLENCLPC